MKSLLLVLLISTGCISSSDRAKIAYQAARLDRAVALINSGMVSKEEEENFIRAEREVWHALNFSVNGTPLPPDIKPSK